MKHSNKNCRKTFIFPMILLITLGSMLLLISIFFMLFGIFLNEVNLKLLAGSYISSGGNEASGNVPRDTAEIDDDRLVFLSDTTDATKDLLDKTPLQMNDLAKMRERISGVKSTKAYKLNKPPEFEIGAKRDFWVLNADTNFYEKVNAKLSFKTPYLYFWVGEDIPIDQQSVAELAKTFENKIHTTTCQIFGSECSPNMNNDGRLTILYTHGLGSVAGYFSSIDSLAVNIAPYSNESEILYLSADYLRLDSPNTYGVLAHEFQHMIHWYVDRDESAWINEGLSELAVELNGFGESNFIYSFASNADLQLNFWPGNEQGDSAPHYGASYLFMKYLMERFGLDAIKELAAEPSNGLTSIDKVFADKDPSLNWGYTAEKLFQDWSHENYLAGSEDNPKSGVYKDLMNFPIFFTNETISCDAGWHQKTVNQFGSDYIRVECPSNFNLEIYGETMVPLLPADPHSGNYYFWSNYGDSSHMTLTQQFDFSEQKGEIILSYWTWFDLESDYDYLYLFAKAEGEEWEMLNPSHCKRDNPTGNNFGCGYNGESSGWINESVDLSKFAGKKVTLQFEYVTDQAVNGDGFLIDDIRIDATGYFSDFERNSGGWDPDGFVRVQNHLAQNFGFGLIDDIEDGAKEKIISVGGLQINETFQSAADEPLPIFIINGLTRYTRQPAVYRIKASSLN